ncbi:MAG: cytochrome b [Nocardioides sp.]
MTLRNGPHGYGSVTKALHWITLAAITGQFVIGYSMEAEIDCDPPGEQRSGGDTTDAQDERLDRLEETCEARVGDGYEVAFGDSWSLVEVHVLLGLTILALAVARVVWRRIGGLPPWAETLSSGERTLVHWYEKVLVALLFVIPLSGLALVLSDDDAVLPLHVAAHIAFFVAIAVHLGLVLKHTLVDRDRLLSRML